MKTILVAASWALAAAGATAAIANEPAAPKPATEHCGDKDHGAHATEPHDCPHPAATASH